MVDEVKNIEIGGRDVLALDAPKAGVNFAKIVSDICNRIQVSHLLGYGHGSTWLFQHLKVGHAMRLQRYMPDKNDTPAVPAQMVACIDVLGYDDYEQVLADLEKLTEAVMFANVVLNDEHSPQWWFALLAERFDVHTYQVTATDEAFFICYAKPKLIDAPNKELAA